MWQLKDFISSSFPLQSLVASSHPQMQWFPVVQWIYKVIIFFLLHSYGAIRSGYGQHFGPQGGQDSGFPSPRSALGYPFPTMQNSYSSYHLGGYAPPCASPPKDGKSSQSQSLDQTSQSWLKSLADIHAHDIKKQLRSLNGLNQFFFLLRWHNWNSNFEYRSRISQADELWKITNRKKCLIDN